MTIQEIWHTLLSMTAYNPLFIFALITVIWFVPGIIFRKIAEDKYKKAKVKDQLKAIAKLYPKEK